MIDLVTGNTLDFVSRENYGGAVAATADGKSLFGNDTLLFSVVTRYDVSAGKLRQVAQKNGYGGGPGLAVTPDGTSVYAGTRCLDGTNLTDVRYRQYDRIYSVTPNGKLAIAAQKVYRVADGTALTDLPSDCSVQAVSPDSRVLYCAGASGITAYSLAGMQ